MPFHLIIIFSYLPLRQMSLLAVIFNIPGNHTELKSVRVSGLAAYPPCHINEKQFGILLDILRKFYIKLLTVPSVCRLLDL
jgi:hypothetical protein